MSLRRSVRRSTAFSRLRCCGFRRQTPKGQNLFGNRACFFPSAADLLGERERLDSTLRLQSFGTPNLAVPKICQSLGTTSLAAPKSCQSLGTPSLADHDQYSLTIAKIQPSLHKIHQDISKIDSRIIKFKHPLQFRRKNTTKPIHITSTPAWPQPPCRAAPWRA